MKKGRGEMEPEVAGEIWKEVMDISRSVGKMEGKMDNLATSTDLQKVQAEVTKVISDSMTDHVDKKHKHSSRYPVAKKTTDWGKIAKYGGPAIIALSGALVAYLKLWM